MNRNFWIGCGSFRNGHNDPNTTALLIDYIKNIALAPATGLFGAAKSGLLKAFKRLITPSRDLTHRVPCTGANADEAVVKPADKVTRGRNLIALINGFNGATLAARAATHSSEVIIVLAKPAPSSSIAASVSGCCCS